LTSALPTELLALSRETGFEPVPLVPKRTLLLRPDDEVVMLDKFAREGSLSKITLSAPAQLEERNTNVMDLSRKCPENSDTGNVEVFC
jgi:hypothetical protein